MRTREIKTIIIKIGTSSLTGRKRGENINFNVLNSIAELVSEIISKSNSKIAYKPVIVSSGAMNLGIAKLGLENLPDKVSDDLVSFKQALTAVGQIELMNSYEMIFKNNYNLHVGQVLVTQKGLEIQDRGEILKHTLEKLFELNIVPIINANDTVTDAEIKFGDNDSLSARIAVLLKAHRLFIMTDCEGLYNSDPFKNPFAMLIPKIETVTEELKQSIGGSHSTVGMGGMYSKLLAGEICLDGGVVMQIMNVKKLDRIPEILFSEEEPEIGTKFIKTS
jgi:glutamate 5-kinase